MGWYFLKKTQLNKDFEEKLIDLNNKFEKLDDKLEIGFEEFKDKFESHDRQLVGVNEAEDELDEKLDKMEEGLKNILSLLESESTEDFIEKNSKPLTIYKKDEELFISFNEIIICFDNLIQMGLRTGLFKKKSSKLY